jgi:outer membrane protein TolC
VFSVTVQRDGFAELVAGGGISLGIPLPAPLGRTAKAEIAESEADTRRARAQVDLTRRSVAQQIDAARVDVGAARKAIELYDDRSLEGARTALSALADAIVAGQIDLRGGLVAQQSLIELLQGRLDAEYELCLASVALAHAAGMDLEAVP